MDRLVSEHRGESLTPLERSRPSTAASAVGVALIIVSAVLPSALLLGVLGVAAAAETRHLWAGAVLFRLGMAALGLYLVVAGRLPIWGGGRRPTAPVEPRPRGSVVVLFGILALALALRLHRLGVGLWYDEVIAYVRYMGMSFGEILTTYDVEGQHFLFTLLARATFVLFGEGPAALRLPAALFGVASVGALYLLARRVATEGEALLAAALLTVSYHHIWFSQNARGYTALLFWTLLSSWLLLRTLDERRPGLWLAYAAAVALGMFTHVTMLFAVLAQAVVYVAWLVRSRAARDAGALSGAVLGFGMAALLTCQLYALVLPQFFSAIGWTTNVPEWTSPLWTLLEVARGLRAGFSGTAAAVVALAVFAVGLISLARTAPVIPVLLLLPATVAGSIVIAMGHPLWPRFFFFLAGFGLLIAVRGGTVAGAGVARALGCPPRRAAMAGTALVMLLVLVSATTVRAAWRPKQDYLGARAFLEAQRQPGDAIVTVGLATAPYSSLYRTGWETANSADALNGIRARARRTWVVYTMPLHLQGLYPEMMRVIQDDFALVRTFEGTLSGGAIYVCRSHGGRVPGAATAQRG